METAETHAKTWAGEPGLANGAAALSAGRTLIEHFPVKDLLAVRKIALPGAVAQIAVATAIGAGLTRLWGWSWGDALVFGLALSVASTVVLLRAWTRGRRSTPSTAGRGGELESDARSLVLASSPQERQL